MSNELVKSDGSAIANLVKNAKLTAKLSPIQERLIVLLDASGSMTSPAYTGAGIVAKTKWGAALEATKELLNSCSPATIAKVITFSNDICDETEFGPPKSIASKLETLKAEFSGTIMSSSLQKSFKILAEDKMQVRRIIVMTDGQTCEAQKCLDIATNCKKNNIIIDAVSFGPDADQGFMQLLASNSGGQHKFAKDATELVKQFKLLEAKQRGLLMGRR